MSRKLNKDIEAEIKEIEAEIKETARGLATGLISGFAWEDTKDGRDYWQDVYKRLLRIAKEGF